MPWLRTIQPDEATGRLAHSYRAAIERAGRVYGIVKAQSLAPLVLDASLGLYPVSYTHLTLPTNREV